MRKKSYLLMCTVSLALILLAQALTGAADPPRCAAQATPVPPGQLILDEVVIFDDQWFAENPDRGWEHIVVEIPGPGVITTETDGYRTDPSCGERGQLCWCAYGGGVRFFVENPAGELVAGLGTGDTYLHLYVEGGKVIADADVCKSSNLDGYPYKSFIKVYFDPDTDRDQVPDSSDQCPNTPQGAEVDENGCSLTPEATPTSVADTTIAVRAAKEGYIEEWWELDNSQNFATVYLSGQVFDWVTGEPLVGANVEIVGGADYASTVTDAGGIYVLSAVVPGGEGEAELGDLDFSLEPLASQGLFVVNVTVEPSELPADGVSTAKVTARVTDADGNPVVGHEMAFKAYGEDGTGSIEVLQSTTDANGTATAIYTAFKPDAGSKLSSHRLDVSIYATDLETGAKGKADVHVNQNQVTAWHNAYIPADSSCLFPSELHIHVADAWDNPMVNALVTVKLEGENSGDGTLVSDPNSGDVNAEITVTTDSSGDAVMYYKWQGQPAAKEILRRVKIIEEQTNDHVEKAIHIGMDLAIAKIVPIAFSGVTGENAHFRIYIKDLMHPGLDLGTFNEGVFSELNVKVTIKQYHSDGANISRSFEEVTGWEKDESGTYVRRFGPPHMPYVVPVNDGYSWYEVRVEPVDRNERVIADSFSPNNDTVVTVKTGSPEGWLTIWLADGILTPHSYTGVIVKCIARYVPYVGTGMTIVDTANAAYNKDLFGVGRAASVALADKLKKEFPQKWPKHLAKVKVEHIDNVVSCVQDFKRVSGEYAAGSVSQGSGPCCHGAKLAAYIQPGEPLEELDTLMDRTIHGMIADVPEYRGLIVFNRDLNAVRLVDSSGQVITDPDVVSSQRSVVVYLVPRDETYSLQVSAESPFQIAVYDPGDDESTRHTYRHEVTASEGPNASMEISSGSDYTLSIDHDGDGRFDGTRSPVQAVLDTQKPTVSNLQPMDGGTVASGSLTISASYVDNPGGSGIDTAAVKIILDGVDRTSEATVTASDVRYQPIGLSAGPHTLTLKVSDKDGNSSVATWVFSVSGSTLQPDLLAKPMGTDLLTVLGVLCVSACGGGLLILVLLLLFRRKRVSPSPEPLVSSRPPRSAPRQAQRAMTSPVAAELVIQQSSNAGQSFPLGVRTRLGRAANNEIVLRDPQISRHHAVINFTGSEYVIVDLGSANGTWVNNVRIAQPYKLSHGDVIAVGSVRLRILIN